MFDPVRVRHDLEKARQTYGGRDWPDSFTDRLTSPVPGLLDVAKMLRESIPARRALDPTDVPRIPVASDTALPPLAAGQTSVTWIGHATHVVRTGGLTILTDPVWSRSISGIPARLTPPGLPLSAVGKVDAVVISHNHYDHLDTPTIRQLPRDTPMLVPAMLGSWFRRRNFTQVFELDWWERVPIGEVTFEFVPSHHWSRRSLSDTCKTLWGGWILTSDDASVYFAGDTGYGHWFREIGTRHPDLDVALLPIGAYEPNWFMKPVHMTPAEAVQACGDLGARRMASMHWGTFMMTCEPVLEPLMKVRAAWAESGRPREDLWDLAIGETRSV